MSKMTTAARKARNEYLKQWQHQNPEKVKAYNARYWERKAAAAAQIEQARENKKDESKL